MMLALSTRDNTVVEEVTLQVRPHCAEHLLPARWWLSRTSLLMREAVLTLQHVMLHHACEAVNQTPSSWRPARQAVLVHSALCASCYESG